MKTDKFDDAIRRKVENIKQDYGEEDIDKAYNYVNRNMSYANWKRYVPATLIASSVLLIAGLLTWNISQSIQQKKLLQKVDTLISSLAKAKANIPTSKTDTIVITKYIIKTSGNSQNINQKSSNETVSTIDKKGNSQKTSEIIINNKNNEPTEVKITDNKQIVKTNLQNAAPQNASEIISNNNNILKSADNKSTYIKQPDEVNNTEKLSQKSDNVIKNNNDLKYYESKPQDSVSIINKKKDELKEAFRLDSLNNNKSLTIISSSPDTSKSENKSGSSIINSLRNIHYQIGLGFEGANRQKGIGLVGEVFLTDRWSISTGLKILGINNEKYFDDNDFHQHKGEYLRNVYDKYVTDSIFAKNIGMKNILLQVPLKVNYKLPLRHNFSLLFSLGTDLDVSAKQFIGYDHDMNFNIGEHKDFQTTHPVVIFNNAMISAGIQKQWKSYVFQLLPFISPQLKSVVYKKEEVYFGLHCNILFSSEK
ncbi:MAG: hypothetical protein Q8880_11435 [Bacteroidota bacterium]|nr:hypothetical protein [Bacteroidota bacterium]